MKKIILTFGLLSGAVSSLMMAATIPFQDRIGFDHGYLVGYTGIVLSFSLVYFGIRSYRDHSGDGCITFARAFSIGLAITVISCLCYVVTWLILYHFFMPDFIDKYVAYSIAKAKASGASPAALAAQTAQLQHYRELYRNPFLNAALTFIEPFPVGLVITLLCAAILRRRPHHQPTPSPLSASN